MVSILMKNKFESVHSIPRGVWPVMLTPFTAIGEIDWLALDALVEWYIEAGVAGLFAVCLSSEMYHLTNEERLSIARRVVLRAAGRVPVVATGTFVRDEREQAEMTIRMAGIGVAAVVVNVNQLAEEGERDSVWQDRAEALLQATGSIELGLYECPVPYKRLLTPALLNWAASTGRFAFYKDTCCSIGSIHAKLKAVEGMPFRWFNANCSTLLESLQAGGDGYSGIGANFVPRLYVWLCANYESQPRKAAQIQRILSVADTLFHEEYPASAKHFLTQLGLPLGAHCRSGRPLVGERNLLMLDHLKGLERDLALNMEATSIYACIENAVGV